MIDFQIFYLRLARSGTLSSQYILLTYRLLDVFSFHSETNLLI